MEVSAKNLKTAAIGLAIVGASAASAFFFISTGMGLNPVIRELAEHTVKTPKAINWVALGAAGVESNSTNKPMLIYFTTENDHRCRLMESELLSDRKAVELINQSYIPVQIVYSDALPETSQEKITCRTFRIREFPTLLVTDFRANVLAGLEGFQSKEATLKFIEESKKPPDRSQIVIPRRNLHEKPAGATPAPPKPPAAEPEPAQSPPAQSQPVPPESNKAPNF